MSYKGFMCNNKPLIQIEDLGRSNIKYYEESIQTSLLSIQIDKYETSNTSPTYTKLKGINIGQLGRFKINSYLFNLSETSAFL